MDPWPDDSPGGHRHRQTPDPSDGLVQLRAVLCDLDNTLLDFMRMKRAASDAAARAMVRAGADFPFESTEAGDMLFGEYMDDIEGDRVFERFLQKHHRQKLSLNQHATDRITAAAVNAYLDAKRVHLEPYPTVRRTLVELTRRGFKMGVVTDAPRFKAYQRLDTAGLTDFFDFVVSSTDTGEQKPHERPFLDAVDLLGMHPQEVVFVGDWPERDLAGASSAGLRTAWAKYGSTAGKAQADWTLARFSDLLKVTALHGAS